MTKAHPDLDKEETEILESFIHVYKRKYSITSKEQAIKTLIRRYKDYDHDVKEAMRLVEK